jgi:hypothetical protein
MLGQEYDKAVADFLRERVVPASLCFDLGAEVEFTSCSSPLVAAGRQGSRVRARSCCTSASSESTSLNQLSNSIDLIGSVVSATEDEAMFFPRAPMA